MFKVIPLKSGQLVRFSISTAAKTRGAHAAATTGHHQVAQFDQQAVYPRIGKREIVGFGQSGEPSYFDKSSIPLPGIRWKEDTPQIKALREKAKGDWGNLSVAEKKELYRADFRITLAELEAPTGEWKFTLGMLLAFMGGSIWLYSLVRNLIYNYPRPEDTSLENQVKKLERAIAQGQGRVHGVSAAWDYEKGDWKK